MVPLTPQLTLGELMYEMQQRDGREASVFNQDQLIKAIAAVVSRRDTSLGELGMFDVDSKAVPSTPCTDAASGNATALDACITVALEVLASTSSHTNSSESAERRHLRQLAAAALGRFSSANAGSGHC